MRGEIIAPGAISREGHPCQGKNISCHNRQKQQSTHVRNSHLNEAGSGPVTGLDDSRPSKVAATLWQSRQIFAFKRSDHWNPT
ncbi:hypothetical protein GRO01_17920 [Gluconobacter roseus NBRC 3990]|uniref:Uncharacterized protein n=1 Tax=Gluconobacter roseus NBRC 3990 TaxID=1307950 RepID=A0A4Y3M8I1_9PROT|nr:hypothetical protein GRO01_17920 [Gluconobacter roseus NBRC 3990]